MEQLIKDNEELKNQLNIIQEGNILFKPLYLYIKPDDP